MQYFKTLPKIRYTDDKNISTIYTNLMARASVIPSMLTNSLLFYQYDIQDDDTPEIVAYKYYGDMNRFWIVLYCNQITDPQWDWPLSSSKFESYIDAKYTGSTRNNVHHYEKTVSKTNRTSGTNQDITNSFETIIITYEDYLILDTASYTYNMSTGTVTIDTTKRVVTNYDYELELNESKRSINILNKSYADQLESEFKKIMS